MNWPRKAKGRTRPRGEMNKTEAAYEQVLRAREQAGEVLWFAYEAVKLRLANNTFYTVDFFVMSADGTLEAHEVKGFWEDDARVKIKVAAAIYPFQFVAVQKDKGGWKEERF